MGVWSLRTLLSCFGYSYDYICYDDDSNHGGWMWSIHSLNATIDSWREQIIYQSMMPKCQRRSESTWLWYSYAREPSHDGASHASTPSWQQTTNSSLATYRYLVHEVGYIPSMVHATVHTRILAVNEKGERVSMYQRYDLHRTTCAICHNNP